MTMHNTFHPDDERLAAYAGGDRDALSDRELVAHLTICDRCRPIVDELTILREALAVLPDLIPSRPLRLIPPVAGPAAPRSGALEWLRRLAAPAMATGAGLVLIGAVGASGVVTNLGANDAARMSTKEAASSDGGAVPVAGGQDRSLAPAPGATAGSLDYAASGRPGSELSGAGASQAPDSKGNEGPPRAITTASGEQPWLTLLIAGFALFGISAVLRYSLTPRAG